MAALMEDVLFKLPDLREKRIVFDAGQVREQLARIVNDDERARQPP
jgi:ATP-dependent protease HslVU (ClpYQ) ATPase subunit